MAICTSPDQLDFEEICAGVHDAWMREKARQGLHPPEDCFDYKSPNAASPNERDKSKFRKFCKSCDESMYPYKELPQYVRDLVRVQANHVLCQIFEKKELQEMKNYADQ